MKKNKLKTFQDLANLDPESEIDINLNKLYIVTNANHELYKIKLNMNNYYDYEEHVIFKKISQIKKLLKNEIESLVKELNNDLELSLIKEYQLRSKYGNSPF